MHVLLADARLLAWEGRRGRTAVRAAAAGALAAARAALATGGAAPPGPEALVAQVEAALAAEPLGGLRPVINASGIVLHTGLGRAPLAPAAAAAAARLAAGYTNLEFDLGSGERGDRHTFATEALAALTGAEAALVVNNNAAAVLLLLAALAAGREVVVSRGELVEIGGSFRLPDVLAQSGARLREVGTTNRTYARDYAGALGPETALLLRVHRSNFAVVGFTAQPDLGELAATAHAHGLPLAYDMGSGALLPTSGAGDVREALAAGADVVTFSGDKLLGGPQAGILCGRADAIRRCAAHPLARAVRVDKLTIAALQATLELYRAGRAPAEVPALRMLGRTPQELRRAAAGLARACRRATAGRCAVAVRPAESAAGAGSLPGQGLPTFVVEVRPAGAAGAQALAAALRAGDPAVVGRLHDGGLWLDPRTVLPGEAALVPRLLAAALERL